jgi:hypothetical protein
MNQGNGTMHGLDPKAIERHNRCKAKAGQEALEQLVAEYEKHGAEIDSLTEGESMDDIVTWNYTAPMAFASGVKSLDPTGQLALAILPLILELQLTIGMAQGMAIWKAYRLGQRLSQLNGWQVAASPAGTEQG